MIFLGSAPAAPASAPMVLNPQPAEPVAKGLILAGSSAELGNYDMAIGQYQDVLRADPYNAAARRGLESVEKKRMEYFKTAADSSRSKMLAQVDEKWEEKVPKSDAYYLEKDLAANREGGVRLQLEARSDAESYTRILENELKDVAREPLSTFSIDVDTASYANVRRFLNQNTIPPADAVRIEELINYFPTAEEGPAPTAKEPFAVRVEMAPCPWQPAHRLARIAIKGRELGNERRNSNLVFLVDVSGSMNEPNKLPLVQQSLRMLTEQLGEEDRVTMVVYAGSSGLVLPPTSGDKKSEIIAAIDKLQAGGSTHGSAGIQLAYEQAVAGFIKEGVNRVILCTDGDFNVGVSSPEELEKLITRKAKSGVFLSVLGFGTGNLKDRTMETLADKGNGNYAYIDSLSEARKVLVEQMSGTLVTIAKDVKIQVEFNPAAVRSYRLIGYENRLMAKEDFNDDTKDAGEIGAGHSVVALYEVVPANLPPGAEPRPAVDSLKYQTPAIAPAQLAEAAKNGETMTVKLRYKAPDSDLSKLIEMPVKDEGKTLTASSEEYKFSAAVAGFGLLLRDSAYKGSLGWETVRRLALDGKGADKLGYRGEFLQLIDKARGLKETRP
ncbi:MAG: von Willebrand factor type A domain-containing protein [Prosthecobacter sp.]|nr:von Willebrand factor type A domain-containing protein [Prosthecobacter sp.]